MSTTRMSILTALAVAGCSAPDETLSSLVLTSDVSSFDGRTEHAVLKVKALSPTGAVGQGAVTLSTPAGHFVDGAELTLADGLATATFVCNPAEDAACNGLLRLGATWAETNASVQIRVTPSVAVTEVHWKAVPTNTLSALNAVAVGTGGRLWAVGNSGTIVKLEGSSWAAVPSGSFADLLGVSFSPSGAAVVVGRQGTLLLERAGALEAVGTGIEVDFTAVYAVSATDVVIGARDGTLYAFDGVAVTAAGALGVPVLSLVASGAEVYAGGAGVLAVRSAGAWTTAALPVPTSLDLAADSPEGLWLGGSRLDASGSVLLLGPTDWRTFDFNGPLKAMAVVPNSVERFVITETGVWRQLGVGGTWTQVDSPMGGRAMGSRSAADLVIVGPPGLSLLRE
jgi:hypothetical protein